MLALASVTVVASVASAAALWIDKRRATKGRWRIPERTLHVIELCGGWPGSLVARRLLRHKTRKRSYRVVAGVIVAVHMALWAVLIGWSAGALGSGWGG